MKENYLLFRRVFSVLLGGAILSTTALHGAAPIPLRAGPVSMLFEPDNAFLRYIRVGSHEVLRGITAPVRNRFWGTVLPVVSKVDLQKTADGFTLTFEATCREREIDFVWNGTIRGSARGEIEYTFDGTARTSFLKNRIGFCVLHGPDAAGKPWLLENIHGEKSKGRFPDFISPHQPAKNLRAIAHELAPGLWAHVRMEGDTFEMEDQRNWTDASFKTYCTPLEIPYPVRVEAGTRVLHEIRIHLEGDVPSAPTAQATSGDRTVLTLAGDPTPLPKLGLQVSSQTSELTQTEVSRLKALNLDHLRVDLSIADSDFPNHLRQAAAQARAIGVDVHVGLRLGSQPQTALARLESEARALRLPVSVWHVLGATPELYRLARPRLKALGAKALVAAAHEDINFTALNRVRPAPDMLEAVVYGMTPQVHAFDDLSIVETLPIITDTVRSARQFVGNAPLFIAPITLRWQVSGQESIPGELPSSVDVRQRTDFAAAWTLGCVKYLAEAGVHGLTVFETVGWKGIMESSTGSVLPNRFPSRPGELFPAYEVLRHLGEFAGGNVQRLESSDALSVSGLALRKGKHFCLLVANLTDRSQSTAVRGLGRSLEVKSVNGSAARTGGGSAGKSVEMELPLVLPPHGIVRMDPRRH